MKVKVIGQRSRSIGQKIVFFDRSDTAETTDTDDAYQEALIQMKPTFCMG